jgi:phage terminase small subunit
MALTSKQAKFVQEYLIDLNATQAAKRAGYSEKTAEQQGYQLLQNPSVAASLEKAMERRAIRTEISADRVLNELAKIGFVDIRKAVRWGSRFVARPPEDGTSGEGEALEDQPHGGALKRSRKADDESDAYYVTSIELADSDELDEATAAAVSEVSQTKEGVRIKFHDKQAALVSMGRHLGLFTDKLEVSASGELATRLLAARQRLPE